MSEAEYIEDGGEYYEIYNDECDDDCMNCKNRHDCDESPYKGVKNEHD